MAYEKKQVLYDLRTTYDGPFKAEDFYKEVDSWINEKRYIKESKKKKEHVTKDGKDIEWLVEIHHQLDPGGYYSVVRLRVLMHHVKEVDVEKGGRRMEISNGSVLVTIDGFLPHILADYWAKKPVYYFIRALIDNYFYSGWFDRFDGAVSADCWDLYRRIKAFFHVQKMKYE